LADQGRYQKQKKIKFILEKAGIVVHDQLQLKRNNKSWYMYDLNYNKKIIEYNGDYWHCNPLLYDDHYYNKRTHKTAKETWDSDLRKYKFAQEQGYEILIIWESEYKKDKQGTIEKCINFLTQ